MPYAWVSLSYYAYSLATKGCAQTTLEINRSCRFASHFQDDCRLKITVHGEFGGIVQGVNPGQRIKDNLIRPAAITVNLVFYLSSQN